MDKQLSALWERGSPYWPACGPWCGFAGRPLRPIFINKESRPLRGAKPRVADDQRLPQERPHQEGSRRRDQGRGTSRDTRDACHDDRDQAGARRALACVVSLFPVWCKGGKRRQEYQVKATISVQQDQDQQNDRMEVIVEPRKASLSEPFGRRGPTLVRISY